MSLFGYLDKCLSKETIYHGHRKQSDHWHPKRDCLWDEIKIISSMIKNLGRDITTLVVAHDMDLVFRLDLNYITVFHYGQVIAEGIPKEIKDSRTVRDLYLGVKWEAGNATTS